MSEINSKIFGEETSTNNFVEYTEKNPKQFLAGLIATIIAIPIAFIIYRINSGWSEQPEKAVQIVGILFAVIGILPAAFYLLIKRGESKFADFGLIIIATISVLLVGSYLFRASFYLNFPADIFIWSESDYVNDILKFRQGYPLFTAEINNESFTYMPGSQLLTYFFAWLTGQATSISAYRVIQVVYTFLSAVLAYLCCRRIVRTCCSDSGKILSSSVWGVIWLTGLFLIATNFLTNDFAHLLHNDALAQLITIAAYWILLEYEATKDKRFLFLMVFIPILGFWVKQSLIIWVGFYCFYLLIFDQPRSYKRIIGVGLAAFLGIIFSIGIGNYLWAENFNYWIFTVLGKHGVSPLRSFRHLLDIWFYIAIGLLGGLTLLQKVEGKKLLGPWLIWLALILTQTYTSGVAWMLNHIGPGCLIAGVWFWAATSDIWTRIINGDFKSAGKIEWLRGIVCLSVICLFFSGLGIVRVPIQPFSKDANRYINEIENEFSGESPEQVLLDIGTWVYLSSGVVMKDRAPSIGERGWSQTGDFSGILQRFKQKQYKKILVRNFHSPDFWYDHEFWGKSSLIRQTLMENYQEVRIIKAVKGLSPNEMPYGFNDISVLIPRTY